MLSSLSRHKHSRHKDKETQAEAERDFQHTELTDRSGGLGEETDQKGRLFSIFFIITYQCWL